MSWPDPDLAVLLEPLSDAQVFTVVLYGEVRSEPLTGIVAVANVVRNRVKADLHNDGKPDWWGEGYRGVLLKPWQFSCLHPQGGFRNYERVKALAADLAAGKSGDAKYLTCAWVARGVLGDILPADLKGCDVKGANHYHTAALTPRPTWAQNRTPLVQIGSHVFYQL
jgi:N-acetylmuramoyl-L-alanine amidase